MFLDEETVSLQIQLLVLRQHFVIWENEDSCINKIMLRPYPKLWNNKMNSKEIYRGPQQNQKLKIHSMRELLHSSSEFFVFKVYLEDLGSNG